MTTVTVEVEDDVLAKATEVLARRDSSVAREVQETLRKIADGEKQELKPRESFAEFLAGLRSFQMDESSDVEGKSAEETMESLQHIRFSPPYSRDEMNER